mgnify:CR=1 FL=1
MNEPVFSAELAGPEIQRRSGLLREHLTAMAFTQDCPATVTVKVINGHLPEFHTVRVRMGSIHPDWQAAPPTKRINERLFRLYWWVQPLEDDPPPSPYRMATMFGGSSFLERMADNFFNKHRLWVPVYVEVHRE